MPTESATPVEDGWYWVSRGAQPGEADIYIGPYPGPVEAATELAKSITDIAPWDEIIYLEPSARPPAPPYKRADEIANARLVATIPGYWARSVDLAPLRREVATVKAKVIADLATAGLTLDDLTPELRHTIETLGNYDVRGGPYRDQLRNAIDVAGRDLAYAVLRRLEGTDRG